jgi:hypothetical protein
VTWCNCQRQRRGERKRGQSSIVHVKTPPLKQTPATSMLLHDFIDQRMREYLFFGQPMWMEHKERRCESAR